MHYPYFKPSDFGLPKLLSLITRKIYTFVKIQKNK
jgi:hypothetical protein